MKVEIVSEYLPWKKSTIPESVSVFKPEESLHEEQSVEFHQTLNPGTEGKRFKSLSPRNPSNKWIHYETSYNSKMKGRPITRARSHSDMQRRERMVPESSSTIVPNGAKGDQFAFKKTQFAFGERDDQRNGERKREREDRRREAMLRGISGEPPAIHPVHRLKVPGQLLPLSDEGSPLSVRTVDVNRLAHVKSANNRQLRQRQGGLRPKEPLHNRRRSLSPTRFVCLFSHWRPTRASLTSQDLLSYLILSSPPEIIGTSSFGDRPSKTVSPVQDLLNDNISENEFANILERQSPDMRRQSVRELASQFKRAMTLLSFTSSIAGELDLNTAMDEITEKIREILKADRATLFVVDEHKKELWARAKRDRITELRIPIDKGIASHVSITGETINISDAYLSPAFCPEIDRLTGYHTKSVLCMPVTGDSGKTVAVLQALNKRGGTFDEEDEQILRTLSIQTAVSLRNSQMYTASKFQQRKIQVLLDVATQLSSELDTVSLLKIIMLRAKELLEADRCTVFLLDRDTRELWSKVADGTEEIRFPMRMGIAGYVATTAQTLNIPEAYEDSRFNKEIDLKTGYRTKSILCMPMRNHQGEVIGATQVLNKKGNGVFDKEDENLLHAFSAQAGVSIENAKLFQKTLEMSNYLQSILKSITNLVLTLDDGGKLLTSNRDLEGLTGIPEETMKKTSFRSWLKENPTFATDIESVYSEPSEVVNMDFDFVKQVNGVQSVVSMKYTVVPLMDFRGAQHGVVIIIEDITPHKRVLNTLSRYMSPSLAEQVIKEGGDRLGGVHVTVTTLFVDIRNFTAISESMDASEVVEMLNEYFEHMVDAIFEENGVLDKYIGDSVMAVFGVPFSREDDARRACRAAQQMLRNLDKFNAQRISVGESPIRVGIGINTGRVLSGNIGSEKRLEYTVIGDGVNLASRVEGVTKEYGLKTLITEFTKSAVGNEFITREIDSVQVVGKAQPIRIYELLGTREEEDPAKLSILLDYSAALKDYRHQKWDEAILGFQRCIDIANDNPSRVLLARCQKMKQNPPDNWNGTWVMLQK